MKGIAKLFFEDGSITHAEFNDLKGIDAFYEIIRIKEGDFLFLIIMKKLIDLLVRS